MSGKLLLKVGGGSGKLFSFGCLVPPKLTNFGTLRMSYENFAKGFNKLTKVLFEMSYVKAVKEL